MRRTISVAILVICFSFTLVSTGLAAGEDKIGTDAFSFVSPTLKKGVDFDLSGSLGKKVILLDFWSIYCVACVQEMPYLIKIQKKYGDDLVTVGVDLDSFGSKRVKKFVKRKFPNIPYTIVIDKRRKVAGLYSVSVLPTTIIISKEGKIVYYHVGFKPGDELTIDKIVSDEIAK